MAKHPVPFSWSAVLLAPLVIPVPATIFLVSGGAHPLAAFVFCALVGYTFTLAVVACLLLPTLWLTSQVIRIRPWLPPV